MKSKDIADPVQIAKWFVNRIDRDAGEIISHLKLQKLVYYAQAWYLANFGKPLFNEEIQAWAHGPVVPSVWNVYKEYGWDAIPYGMEPELEDHAKEFLEALFEQYGDLGAKALENLTHKEDPWKKTRGNIPLEARCTKPIDKELMREFYARKIKRKHESANNRPKEVAQHSKN